MFQSKFRRLTKDSLFSQVLLMLISDLDPENKRNRRADRAVLDRVLSHLLAQLNIGNADLNTYFEKDETHEVELLVMRLLSKCFTISYLGVYGVIPTITCSSVHVNHKSEKLMDQWVDINNNQLLLLSI
jgi:hypothetical protein